MRPREDRPEVLRRSRINEITNPRGFPRLTSIGDADFRVDMFVHGRGLQGKT